MLNVISAKRHLGENDEPADGRYSDSDHSKCMWVSIDDGHDSRRMVSTRNGLHGSSDLILEKEGDQAEALC